SSISEGRILIDSLPDSILLLDKDAKLIRSNRFAQQMLGGLFFQDTVIKILNYPQIKEKIQRALYSSEESGTTLLYVLPAPYKRYFIVRVQRFPDNSPSGIAVILVLHDITELKHTEQVLSDFVANASHEIRTPLTSISGLIETLQTTAHNDPTVQDEFLQIM